MAVSLGIYRGHWNITGDCIACLIGFEYLCLCITPTTSTRRWYSVISARVRVLDESVVAAWDLTNSLSLLKVNAYKDD